MPCNPQFASAEQNARFGLRCGRPHAIRDDDIKVLCNAPPRTVSEQECSSTKRNGRVCHKVALKELPVALPLRQRLSTRVHGFFRIIYPRCKMRRNNGKVLHRGYCFIPNFGI